MRYSETVLDHFQNPRNVGKMEDADGVGEAGNSRCGDIMKLYLRVDENEVITDAKFNAFGCCGAIAAGSMATELLRGSSIAEALELTNEKVVEALGGLPPQKLQCSVLAEQAIHAAVRDYRRRKSGKAPEDLLDRFF